MKTVWFYAAAWVGMIPLAIVNGVIREKAYGKFMDELTAHQVSTVIAIGLFGIYIWVLTGIRRLESSGQALAVGGLWLVMTMAFEFGFGHYVMGHSWSRLLHDYNLFRGRVWSLVLVWMTVAPYLYYRIRG
ncbi:MAG: hypothetical protein ACOZF0_05550 [Thermodesulfobacteriota bacterium]